MLSIDDWQAVLDRLRGARATTWRVELQDGSIMEGRITHDPLGPPDGWDTEAKIFVGAGEIGKPVLVRSIRAIRPQ